MTMGIGVARLMPAIRGHAGPAQKLDSRGRSQPRGPAPPVRMGWRRRSQGSQGWLLQGSHGQLGQLAGGRGCGGTSCPEPPARGGPTEPGVGLGGSQGVRVGAGNWKHLYG